METNTAADDMRGTRDDGGRGVEGEEGMEMRKGKNDKSEEEVSIVVGHGDELSQAHDNPQKTSTTYVASGPGHPQSFSSSDTKDINLTMQERPSLTPPMSSVHMEQTSSSSTSSSSSWLSECEGEQSGIGKLYGLGLNVELEEEREGMPVGREQNRVGGEGCEERERADPILKQVARVRCHHLFIYRSALFLFSASASASASSLLPLTSQLSSISFSISSPLHFRC